MAAPRASRSDTFTHDTETPYLGTMSLKKATAPGYMSFPMMILSPDLQHAVTMAFIAAIPEANTEPGQNHIKTC